MWSDAVPNLLIGLREGLEGGLIVSIVLAAVVRSGRRAGLAAVWLGVACALALSLAFGAVLTFAAADLSTAHQEAIGGVLSLVAVGFVTWMVFWMRRSARTLAGDLRQRTESALVLGSRVLFVTAFLAVAREGLETALFLWSTTRTASESTGPLLGALIGLLIATGLCWALYRRSLKINLSRFFTWTGAALVVIAAGVVAYGLGELQGANILGGRNSLAFDLSGRVDPTSWYARLIEGVFNLTPSMTVLQVVGYLAYLVPVLGLFVVLVRRSAATGREAAGSAPVAVSASAVPSAVATTATSPAAIARTDPTVGLADEPTDEPTRRPTNGPTDGPNRARRRQAWVAVGVVGVVGVAGTAVAIAAFGTKPTSASPTIVVADDACAEGWSAPAAGQQTFAIRNTSSALVEVYLMGADRRTAHGELEGLAPGTTRFLSATLPAGEYSWKCIRSDGTESFSSVGRVTGSSSGAATADTVGRAYIPATRTELVAAATLYRTAITPLLATLQTDTRALLDAVAADPTSAAAKTAWLSAHLDYVRLGAAYGTFGELDAAINGRPDGLADGVDDPGFTGFGRLEHELWQQPVGADAVATARQLKADVDTLAAEFSSAEIEPVDLPLRAHEILENGLQFELTGASNHGSDAALATLRAEFDATTVVLDALQTPLGSRDPQLLTAVRGALDDLRREVDSHRHPDGTWPPLASLSRTDRQRLNGATGHFLEVVAPVPDLLELPTSSQPMA